jgi:hypothetical protein
VRDSTWFWILGLACVAMSALFLLLGVRDVGTLITIGVVYTVGARVLMELGA